MKIKIYKQCHLEHVQPEAHAVCATFTTKAERFTIEGSHLFLSCSWKANIEGLGIERLNVNRTDTGFLAVNRQAQTSIPHIFAVGDVTGEPLSAVKAIKQGKVAAETMAGKAVEVDWTFFSTVVYSTPPIASVGLTEEEAKQQYEDVRIGQFPLTGNGYASIVGQKEGLVKVISDAKTDVVLGVHIIGAGAVELISSGVIGLEMVGREEDFVFPLYPHPSVNESLLEAMEALTGKAVHLPPAKKEAVSR